MRRLSDDDRQFIRHHPGRSFFEEWLSTTMPETSLWAEDVVEAIDEDAGVWYAWLLFQFAWECATDDRRTG